MHVCVCEYCYYVMRTFWLNGASTIPITSVKLIRENENNQCVCAIDVRSFHLHVCLKVYVLYRMYRSLKSKRVWMYCEFYIWGFSCPYWAWVWISAIYPPYWPSAKIYDVCWLCCVFYRTEHTYVNRTVLPLTGNICVAACVQFSKNSPYK